MKRRISFSFFVMAVFYGLSFSQDSQAPAAPAQDNAAPAPATVPAAAAPSFSVDSIAIADHVESRIPAGIASEFPWDIGRVSCWIKISSSRPPVPVKFLWYKNDELVLEWPYSLLVESGRLWSTKAVATGKWKVEIVDAAKNVVKTASFEVKERQ
jgi:hypothetical protein